MTHTPSITTDIAIFGGGIAGLWLLERLKRAGFSALLFETNTLGGGQTGASQGIIHGGTKYTLTGSLTEEAKALAAMPERWMRCLQGIGECTLTTVPILSAQQILWSPKKLTAKLIQIAANHVLQTPIQALKPADYPRIFQHPQFSGHAFAIREITIDAHALVRTLAALNASSLFHIDTIQPEDMVMTTTHHMQALFIRSHEKRLLLHAQCFIFTAGAGNEIIVKQFKQPHMTMQKRPLHMVAVKPSFQLPLYAHCLGLSARPRLTISTHYRADGSLIWYIGGALAEDGITRDKKTQIKAAKKELHALFPWLDFSNALFETHWVERVEAAQTQGLKPISCTSKMIGNICVGWPTKLALAPQLADDIMQQLQQHALQPMPAIQAALTNWPQPALALPFWETLF